MMGITAPAIWATICPIGAMISARAATICMMIGMSACITAFSGGSRVVIMLRIGWISALTTSSSGGSTVDTRLTMTVTTWPMASPITVMTGAIAEMMDDTAGSRLAISVVMGGNRD